MLTESDKSHFAVVYLAHGRNATEAARALGFTGASAKVRGSQLLADPDVQAEIEKRRAEATQLTKIDAEVLIRELIRIAMTDIGEAFDDKGALVPLSEMPVDLRRAISSIEVEERFEKDLVSGSVVKVGEVKKIKLWSKERGLEMLARTLALFKDSLSIKDDTEMNENEIAARTSAILEQLRKRAISDSDRELC